MQLRAIGNVLLTAIAVFAAFISWLFVYLRSLPIPVGDQWWDTVYTAALTRQGKLSASEIFTYSEGHRLVNMRLITWLATVVSDYNIHLLNLTTWAIAAICVYLAFQLFCSSSKAHGISLPQSAKLTSLALFSLTVFCISHGQNWIDFYFSQWQLSLLFALLAALVVKRTQGSWKSLIILIIIAVLASFSIGLGLSSWVAIPVMALANKSFRRLPYFFAWASCASGFFLFYFSDFARFGSKVSIGTFWNSLNPKSIALVVGFYLSRRFIPDTGYSMQVKIALIFSLTCLLVTGVVIFLLCKRHYSEQVFPWLGVAAFSLSGAVMVSLSRGDIMPSERHSPGSDGFWLGFIALSVLYICITSKPLQHKTYEFARFFRVILFSLLALLGLLSGWRTSAAFRQTGDWRSPAYFPRSCINSTRTHPLLRDLSFRRCFVFGDERSIYQLTLMKLGNLSGSYIERPIYNNKYMNTIVVVPSRLMAAFTDRYMLEAGKKTNEANGKSVSYLSPLKEKPLLRLWPAPIARDMNWNDLGRGSKTPETIHDHYQLTKIVKQFATEKKSILLISAREMNSETAKAISILKSNGFKEAANDSLTVSNQRFPSLRAICFEAEDKNRAVSDRGCMGKHLSRIVSGGTHNE